MYIRPDFQLVIHLTVFLLLVYRSGELPVSYKMDRITSKASYFVEVFSFRGFEDIVLNLKPKIEIIKNGLKYDLQKANLETINKKC